MIVADSANPIISQRQLERPRFQQGLGPRTGRRTFDWGRFGHESQRGRSFTGFWQRPKLASLMFIVPSGFYFSTTGSIQAAQP